MSRSSRSRPIGHAPSEVFEITVWVVADAGRARCGTRRRRRIPATSRHRSIAWSQKPRP